jgi:ATP-dependent Clp protease ATP-binding subunit ClpB
VLDDGRLTDGHGRTVDFKNTVLVMTSNLGSDVIQTLAGAAEYEEMKTAVMGIVTQHFRPEFLNRVDDVVVFHPLSKDQIVGIAKIQLQILQRRLQESDISLDLDVGAMEFLVDVGYDPVYGARPLKRAIQRYIENPLAQELLAGHYKTGDKIQMRREGNELVCVAN